MDPVRPAYGGTSLERVVPALLAGATPDWLPAPARDAAAVVLLVLDGLGWHTLREQAGALPTLAGLAGGPITTVVPSTTAAALTSLTTGLAPIDHGVVGFRMRVDGAVLNVLRWQLPDGRRPPDPFTVQRRSAFGGRPVAVVTKAEFAASGFTAAHLRGARFVGWRAPSTLVHHCVALARAGEPFVYGYYPGIDSVAHEYGLSHPAFAAELGFVDHLVARLLDGLPTTAALVVTSDHGHVEVPEEGWRALGPLDELCAARAGEGRFRYLYARRGAAAELAAAAAEHFGADAWVLPREQLLDEGWLGPPPARASVRRRVGDVTLAARGPVAFLDPDLPREAELRGLHGSCTAAEMLVPLLAGRGRGR
jgi:hypothetical protein